MQFGFFLHEGFSGVLTFSHDYFKEAVQALLLDGMHVVSDAQLDPNLPPCRQNIGKMQKSLHVSIIVEILKNQLKKDEFDFTCQIENGNELETAEFSQQYLEILNELFFHLYMIYDLVNLCKLLTNFKYELSF